MALFDEGVLRRATISITEIPPNHLEVLGRWADMVRQGSITKHNETALDGDFKAQIVEGVLGYRPAGHPKGQTVDKEHYFGSEPVDLALGRFGESSEVIAPFELKGADTRDLDAPMLGRRESAVEQAWRYALMAGRSVRWVLVTNYLEIRLYSYRDGVRDYEAFDVSRLDRLEEYRRFVTLLSAENLLGTRTSDLLRESFAADKKIGDEFYAHYQQVRETLIGEIASDGSGHAPEQVVSMAQTILDRILFVAFAEDRELLPGDILRHAAEARNAFAPVALWDNLKGLFRLVDKGGTVSIEGELRTVSAYNGGLFRGDTKINALTLSDDTCTRLLELGGYDFAEKIDVTILGHIFEQSLRDLERHLALARGEESGDYRTLGRTSNQIKDHGIVYTPEFVARFITDRTLGAQVRQVFAEVMDMHAIAGDPSEYESLKWVKGNAPKQAKASELAAWRAYRDRLMRLRVVDPACGSGIFLVMAFDFLKREYDRVNGKIEELAGVRELFDIDAEILSRNLYGVDVNAESVEITKLSLWLKTAKRGKTLASLEHTIRTGDSLIEDASYAYLSHGFTWRDAFPEVFDEGGFDVVLGNPPYVRMELIKAMKPYLETRYAVVSDRADLYAYFYERGLRLLRADGRLGYVSNNTFFKTGSGRPLRSFLRAEAILEEVADFGDLQIFEGVTTYPVIMVMRRGAPAEDHTLSYWNVDAVPETEFGAAFDAAAASYPQSALTSGSWELEDDAPRALRTKLTDGHPTLSDTYGTPLYGIKTGLNGAFVIDRATREQLVAQDPRSEELLRPWLEGRDLRRWRVETRDLFVIYTPKKRICIDEYPAIRDHLAPYREYAENNKLRGLDHRATKQEWFELQQAQEAYVPTLEGVKIVYRDVADQCAFSMERFGAFVDCTCFFIPTDHLEALAFLNSAPVWFLMKAMTPEFRGGFARFKSQFVGQLPIPDGVTDNPRLAELARDAQAAAESRRASQRNVRRRIPDLCPPEHREADGSVKLGRRLEAWWTLDFPDFRAEVKKRFRQDIPLADRSDWEDMLTERRREIEKLNAEIARAEAEIDRIVYDLFDLTAEEIALVEAAKTQTKPAEQ